MWVYMERDVACEVISLLRAAGKSEIAENLDQRMREEADDLTERYRKAARDVHQVDGELEFDPSAVVSRGSDAGAYVMGWQWIADEEAGIASECELEPVDD